jgi:undecaprenyl-diphosphatase
MDQLLNLDRKLFKFINHELSNDFFNWLMPTMRNAIAWVPLYLFLILFAAINYKKTGWWWIAFAVCTVILTNYISSNLIKHNIIRIRPCNNPDFANWINVLVAYKPQSSSFTSSHAANHFGIAMYLYLTLKKLWGKWASLFFVWASLICFSQVYVGVHYPIDVAAGALIGIIIGYLSGFLFNKNYGLQ